MVQYFDYLPAEPSEALILHRLGYHKQTTVLEEGHQKVLTAGLREGKLLCQIRGALGRFRIIARSSESVTLENGAVLHSKSLSSLLAESDEVSLMAATAGAEIVARILFEIQAGDPVLGVILDSIAAQTVDAGLNFLSQFTNKFLAREGKKLTKHRYSPGYGDLELTAQLIIFEMLNLDKLDLSLTEKYMLVPEKSVLAIAGIEGVR